MLLARLPALVLRHRATGASIHGVAESGFAADASLYVNVSAIGCADQGVHVLPRTCYCQYRK